MRPGILIFLTAGLAACAVVPTLPQEARLTSNELRVDFGQGVLCRGSRSTAVATETGWRGQLEGCPLDYAYEVEMQPGTNPVRYVLVEGAEALGADELFAPLALARIQLPNGREVVFQSPPENTADDQD